MHRFKVLMEAVSYNGQCSLHLFITPATNLHTSGERVEVAASGSSLVPNMGIGSFDQIPLSPLHIFPPISFPASTAPPPSALSVSSRWAAAEQGTFIF